MRILIIGASGTIGAAVASALSGTHELVLASRSNAHEHVDITSSDSIRALYRRVGRVDAIVSAAGGAAWKPLAALTDADFAMSFGYKLMGQVNVIRHGFDAVADGGSITVTSGILAQKPQESSAAVSLVNAGLEGFARAAALEAPRGIRVNVVSPPWVSETLAAMGADPQGGLPATTVARTYADVVVGRDTGRVVTPTAQGAAV